MVRNRKDQHTVGRPVKPRGQQTGYAGNPDQNREEMEATPAVRGRRKKTNKMSADVSTQHIASNPVTPSTNSPSMPAMNTRVKGDTGGEQVFKQHLARRRAAK